MRVHPIFFYDVAEGEGGGSGGTDVLDKPAETQQQAAEQQQQQAPPANIPEPVFTVEEMKSFGFDTPDDFKSFLAKHKESQAPKLTPEEIKEKENIEKANFLKFSAESKLLTVEENNKYETLKAKSDNELVFENFLTEYKEDHPEITDEDELLESAKEDFYFEFKTKSENEAIKKKGEVKLAKAAKELRSEVESKVTEAQNQFKEYNTVQSALPKFNEVVTAAITKNTPDKLAIVKLNVGDKDNPKEVDVEIEISKEDRAAMDKAFKTPKTLNKFMSAKPEEFQAYLDAKQQSWLKANKVNEIAHKAFEIGSGIGVKNGSDVGAENPFALKQGAHLTPAEQETLAQSDLWMEEDRKRRNQGQ